jgi:aspartyl-tRNA(Asn)/glutamyl-tRNA(Gln) amidotransferase subunit B
VVESVKIKPEYLVEFIDLIDKGTVSGPAAKTVFEDMFNSGKQAQEIINEKGLSQISDTDEIEKVVIEVIAGNEKAVSDFNAGKQQSLAFLVGQVMKATKGRANPAVAKETLLDKLGGNKGA